MLIDVQPVRGLKRRNINCRILASGHSWVPPFGDCYLGLELSKRLGLEEFFTRHLDQEFADVPWSRVAAALAINRLCDPGSELAIERHWYPGTVLDDLLHIGTGKINDTRLYRCLDSLLPLKTKIKQHLKQRFGELFQAEFDVLLYDLTSTYVEGTAEGNPMKRRGYSRDHRPDCEQLVLALIVNADGFPFSYELFDGNRADVSTVEAILRTVERKHGTRKRCSPIPETLWSSAVELAREHGLHRTAQTLRLNYYSLKKRFPLISGAPGRAQKEPTFVELFPPPGAAGDSVCTIEMENVQGGKMTRRLRKRRGSKNKKRQRGGTCVP